MFKTNEDLELNIYLRVIKKVEGDLMTLKRSKFDKGVATRVFIKIHPDDIVRVTDAFNTYVSELALVKVQTANGNDTNLLN
jgi:hypothetical protein